MPAKIRLQRFGRKRYAYYHIVIADSRAPRDGRFIERIGSYNPNTNPATIDLDFDKALTWLNKGAQPTDTVRAILSYKGVMYMKHLLGGVAKGSFSEEEAQSRFKTWIADKEAKIQAKKDRLSKDADASKTARLEAETKISEERTAAIAKREADAAAVIADAAAAVAAAEAPEEVVEEEAAEEVVAEETAEEVVEEAKDVPAEETPAEGEAKAE